MVRLASFVLLATALVTSSTPTRILPRTAAQIETDLNTLISSITSLDTSIKNLSTGFAAVGPVETDTGTVLSNLQTAINDVKATSALDLSDGQAILTLIEQLETLIITTLHDLDNAASELETDNTFLPGILTLIKDDLNSLAGNTTILESALLAISPAQLKPSASTIIANVNAAFSTAVAIYATAT